MRKFAAILTAVAVAAGMVLAVPAAPAAARPMRPLLRVMPLGDSITYGLGSSTRSGYRYPLAQGLYRAGARLNVVGTQFAGVRGQDNNHQGHSGWTVGQLLYGNGQRGTGINAWCRANPANIYLIHIGTNDLRDHIRTPAHLMARRLEELLRRIRVCTPGAYLFVARPIVTRAVGRTPPASSYRWNQRLAAYDRLLPGVVARSGPHAFLVDMRYATGPDGMADAMHPNDRGYDRIAGEWLKAIRFWLPNVAHW